ncbi:hypothetical protein LJR225_004804 [Phenylobacterium sp. LjRoot225]|uniref:hypothetical protein n=1 Tax=Phenylobacterium sp. LjRoot225 TaxID=3342285 RepID=UPI003ECF7096
MPKVDVTFGPRRELGEPRFLDFVASRPLARPRSEHTSGPPGAEDRPLHLDLATRELQRRRPGMTRQGFAEDPAAVGSSRALRPVRDPRSRRGLLAVGLTAVVGLGVAGALWSYPALERRITGGGSMPEPAPSASPAVRPAEVAAIKPLAEVHEAELPAPLDAAALAPSPALRREVPTEPAPEVAKPKRQETPARPEASAATARANIIETHAPKSTLSAQLAAQTAGD